MADPAFQVGNHAGRQIERFGHRGQRGGALGDPRLQPVIGGPSSPKLAAAISSARPNSASIAGSPIANCGSTARHHIANNGGARAHRGGVEREAVQPAERDKLAAR